MLEADKYLLNDLLRCVWEDIDTKEIHPKEMDAMSFCALENNQFVGYVGVITWNIKVKGKILKMCGLSCVCTHPQYRKRGIATILVKKATEWIMQSDILDVGLFTCSHKNTPFYENIGLWKISPNLVLKESDRKDAYVSDLLHLNVFKLLISQKAESYANCFENATIILNFPKGKFI